MTHLDEGGGKLTLKPLLDDLMGGSWLVKCEKVSDSGHRVTLARRSRILIQLPIARLLHCRSRSTLVVCKVLGWRTRFIDSPGVAEMGVQKPGGE